jgi:hypothetical protein
VAEVEKSEMSKKPKQVSIVHRMIAMIKRNPITSIASLVAIFVGIPGTVASYNSYIEPIVPASHNWVREWGNPIILTQNNLATAIDHRLLYEQQKDLEEVKKDPGVATSPVVQQKIKDLEEDVHATQSRICKATGKKCPP